VVTYLALVIIDFIPEAPTETTTEEVSTDAAETEVVVDEVEVQAVEANPLHITIDKLDREVTVLNPESRNIADLDATLSAPNFNAIEGLKMYPNPATDMVYFSKEISFQIFDLTGKIIFTANQTQSINIQGLSKGVYFVKTTEGETRKLMVN
jgi:hypothetical protein